VTQKVLKRREKEVLGTYIEQGEERQGVLRERRQRSKIKMKVTACCPRTTERFEVLHAKFMLLRLIIIYSLPTWQLIS
jgi:hypothetical protein